MNRGTIRAPAAGRGAIAGYDDAGEGINRLYWQELQNIQGGIPQVAVHLNLLIRRAAEQIPDR